MAKKDPVKCGSANTTNGPVPPNDQTTDTTWLTAPATTPTADGAAGDGSGKTPDCVTATVTEPPDPWADHPGVPEEFLRNEDNTWKHPLKSTAPSPTASVKPRSTPAAKETGARNSETAPSGPTTPTGATTTAPAADTSAGSKPGDEFEKFKVDPKEIDSKIRHEADRRWRAWVPTKEHLSRPRMSFYVKQVRKEFYP